METSGRESDPYRTSGASGAVANGGLSRSYAMQLSTSSFIQALTAFLEYSGVLRSQSSNHRLSESFLSGEANGGPVEHASGRRELSSSSSAGGDGEVLIRIIVPGDHDGVRSGGQGPALPSARVRATGENSAPVEEIPTASDDSGLGDDGGSEYGAREVDGSPASQLPSVSPANTQRSDGEGTLGGANSSESSYQRFDIQQLAKWVEQILPFSLLLLVVFIRQHLQGFFVTIWIAAVMFKSNDILRKQTALKGERKMLVLVVITVVFMLHVFGVYWWYRNDDILNPLVLLPPKEIPPFWHAIFIILVNDTMVRQAAMVLKCVVLMCYRNNRGRSYRKQGQMLTLLEYFLFLYRALLPAPVWYRFFLNKEYGSFFSSLITGLYLTIKLTTIVDKIHSFLAAVKSLSCKDVHYGSHATAEQVIIAGDLCAICQEKMQTPILLRCKHIFCEDCVSEW
ncbi:RING finger and transmembrane domain-containing protein 2-like [Phalaenopsis equestris]|uniref:RING finger and transmembrane domain-containing protein 2-like n=1 Tax=Phalaenopsis equestris TaxID=78828 RepID=UPI0009E3DC60|nr:RING finger and transmembrane domain-containing protein 2-like [Phalaenopsis equestris]